MVTGLRVGSMPLTLRPMADEEFVAWLPLLREEYAHDLIRDYDLSADQAQARALAEIDGHRTAEHSVFVIEVEGEQVGHLWLVERRDAYEPTLIVYDIDVDEPHRGRGYGKAAMVFTEEEARRRGLARIALHVGARNDVARTLYRSLGFDEHEVSMSKLV
jgi:GNAT superfamily N-acetyltransferase